MTSSINASTTAGVVTTADTSGVLNIQTAGTTAISIDASQAVSFTNSANLPNTFGFKNRIINGAMVIAQRATSSNAVSGGGYTTLDRWNLFQNLGAMNIAQSSTAPTGFSNSMQFTVSTAASQTSSATSLVVPNQSIEGFNTADLGWGTANAKSITVSVWVYSSLIGQYAIWIRNNAADRFYATSFTITTANTWQQVTATIAGDTSGTWVGATNGIGLTIGICLAAGSSRVGTANTWSASTTYGVTGQVDWQATASNTFYFTGFQVEKGSTATSFDYRPYGTELALCQRYYFRFNPAASGTNTLGIGRVEVATSANLMLFFPVQLRTAPTALEQSGTAGDYAVRYTNSGVATCNSVPTFSDANVNNATANFTVASGLTGGQSVAGRAVNTNAYLAWSAEL